MREEQKNEAEQAPKNNAPIKGQRYRRRIFKTVFGITAVFLALWLLMRLPVIQTYLANKISKSIEKTTGMPTTIGKVNFNWFDVLELEDINILDTANVPIIKVKSLTADFSLFSMQTESGLTLDKATIDGADVAVLEHPGTNIITISDWTDRLSKALSGNAPADSTAVDSTDANSPPFVFRINEISLRNSIFRQANPGEEPIENGFDYYNFNLLDINGELENMEVRSDTFMVDILHLTCVDEKTGLKVKKIAGQYLTSPREMEYRNLDLEIGKSHLKTTMKWTYQDYEMGDFNKLVHIDADVKESVVSPKDLGLFNEFVAQQEDIPYIVEGKFVGTVENFMVKDFAVSFGAKSSVMADFEMIGLPNTDETFMTLRFKPSTLDAGDLNPFFTETYDYVKRLHHINFNGQLTGFLNDFVAYGTFKTALGSLNTDINLKLPLDDSPPVFSGSFSSKRFDAGTFLDFPFKADHISANGQISGRGLTLDDMSFKLKSEVDNLRLNGYDYTNINTDAEFSKGIYKGKLNIDDPNLNLISFSAININPGQEQIHIRGALKKALLKQLGFTDKTSFLKTEMEVDLSGLSPDTVEGEVSLNNTYMTYENRALNLGNLTAMSDRSGDKRELSLDSDVIDMRASGIFNLSELPARLALSTEIYLADLLNRPEQTKKLIRKEKRRTYADTDLRIDINFKDFTPVLRLFEPEAHISQNTHLESTYIGGKNNKLELNAYCDSFCWSGFTVSAGSIDFSTERRRGETQNNTHLILTSEEQKTGKVSLLKETLTEIIWTPRNIDFLLSTENDETDTKIELTGTVDYEEGQAKARLNGPKLRMFGNNWSMASDNLVTISDKEFQFEGLSLSSDKQSINIEGAISPDSGKPLNIFVNKLNLAPLGIITGQKVEGDADINFVLRDFYKKPNIIASAETHGISFDGVSVGDFSAVVMQDPATDRVDVFGNLTSEGRELLDINGNYLAERPSPLNIDLTLLDIPLNTAEPFLKDYVSNISGTATGSLKLGSDISHPVLSGQIQLNNGEVKVDYLNTRYRFHGDCDVDENLITLNNIDLTDEEGNKGKVYGDISHEYFQDFAFNIEGDFRNFISLNTTAKDNDLYYGKAYGTGKITVLGPPDNVQFTASLRTEQDSKVYILMDDGEEVDQATFIEFTNLKDQRKNRFENNTKKIQENASIEGFNVVLNLDITPEAHFFIIMDQQTGDLITGNGKGNLRLEIESNEESDFKMYGDFVFNEGVYNFVYQNVILINKNFNIEPDSKVSWSGDPFGAIMDVKATYNLNASFAPLVEDVDKRTATALRRQYPTTVDLLVSGSFTAPVIDFGIRMRGYPESVQITYEDSNTGQERTETYQLGANIRSFLQEMNTDTQELNRQAFMLTMFGYFSPRNTFNVSGTIGNSLSEFMSNQLNSAAGEIINDLEVQLDLGNLTDTQFETLQLRLSYSFLDGRLRLTREGGFTDNSNEASFASVVGDWMLEWNITNDGKWKAKLYNRNNYSNTGGGAGAGLTGNTYITAGASLQHTTDFDSFWDLFRRGRNNKQKQNRRQRRNESPSDSVPTDISPNQDKVRDEKDDPLLAPQGP
ncbi:DUF490 domain-containing protein [Fulvitalea axinellae]|uniref:DUF490 domain-containing protein n=1 Tax=Fulvitalea axinellae TaxID=1182444 RepID=A0AAU9CZ56_9BACT|nr:DUF490 domain-containing protein [Fulvitalea axinellae]